MEALTVSRVTACTSRLTVVTRLSHVLPVYRIVSLYTPVMFTTLPDGSLYDWPLHSTIETLSVRAGFTFIWALVIRLSQPATESKVSVKTPALFTTNPEGMVNDWPAHKVTVVSTTVGEPTSKTVVVMRLSQPLLYFNVSM